MEIIASFFINGKLFAQAVVAAIAFGNSLEHGGRIELASGSDTDDIYVAMELKIIGLDAGCVHDYDSRTKRVTFGECFNGVTGTIEVSDGLSVTP